MDGFKEFHLVETEIFSYTLKRLPSTVGAECSRDRVAPTDTTRRSAPVLNTRSVSGTSNSTRTPRGTLSFYATYLAGLKLGDRQHPNVRLPAGASCAEWLRRQPQ